MRDIPEDLVARLQSGVTTLAHVWRIVRRDDAVFGFTDHDAALVFDALICAPVTGLIAGAVEKSVGLGVDTASVSGALSAEAISEQDLARGVWDGARVDLFRVDWTAPALRVHLFAGRLGEVRRGVSAFEAELRGLQADLNVPVGRVFARHCDARLGDARCSEDIDAPAFRGEGVILAPLSSTAFRATGLEGFADGWFARGRVLWTDGAASEVSAHRVESGGATIELLDPMAGLSAGAVFTIFAGCDKRIETCRVKFANVTNFRGFPHMPGNDAIQSGPVAGERLDGGSRLL